MSDGIAQDWLESVRAELVAAQAAWKSGNAGRGRVASRRAAGLAFRARLARWPQAQYGTSFMHHLAAAADDQALPVALRESAWRLAARPAPAEGWSEAPPQPLTPMADALIIIKYVRDAMVREASGDHDE